MNQKLATSGLTSESSGTSDAGGACRQESCTCTLRPAADIVESSDNVTLYVELPGVSESNLEIALENGLLEVTATPQRSVPDGYRPLGSAALQRKYYRQFKLADTLDTTAIQASLSNGLLSLTLPKKPENRRTRITVGGGGNA